MCHHDRYRYLDSPGKRQRSGYKHPAAPFFKGLAFSLPPFLQLSQSVFLALPSFRNLYNVFSEQKTWL